MILKLVTKSLSFARSGTDQVPDQSIRFPVTVQIPVGCDKVNLKKAYHTPLSGSYEFKYDRDRRPTEIIFPSLKKIVNKYADGLLNQVQTPEGTIDFTYACGGKVETVWPVSARGKAY